MKQIYPDFYPEFRCLAGDCPDTCCKDWEVVVDPEAMEFYQSVPGALGERLKNGFVEQDGDICFRLENGKCTFLTEDGLCELQKTFGEKGLCRICASHPRFLEEYGATQEITLSISCPEAARIILSCQEPVRFLAEETDEEDDFEEFDFMMFSQLEDTRDVLFRILQNRELPLQERMTAAEQLAEQYQICMEEQREYDIDDLLRKYEKHLEEGTLSECVAESLAEKGVDAASFHAYDRQVKELAVFFRP